MQTEASTQALGTSAALERAAAQLAQARFVVFRGLPGSGKTTLARLLAQGHGFRLFEADQHFERPEGYCYDPARVADAHAACVRAALEALEAGARVAVANTHVRRWELAAALGVARLAGVEVDLVECTGAWPNVHGVDHATLEAMAKRWEVLPRGCVARLWRWDGGRLELETG
ncbi:MAG: ATP-binding protein [Casimicrobiaceae bacterium]|nr:ATP-binding protein [Casimicrobiaceae bacterium]MCX8099407.1 ATP-binding protein [Casimicrobiaceae bacterium]MDW8311796.1 AAA family ATPase [Burkholderiales bacterium]